MAQDEDPKPPPVPDGQPPTSSYPAFEELVSRSRRADGRRPVDPPPFASVGAPLPYDPAPPAQHELRPKRPRLAVLASALLPGAGSIMSEEVAIGALILVLYALGWILSVLGSIFAWIGVPVLAAAWVWGLVHAHLSARRWNRRHGIG